MVPVWHLLEARKGKDVTFRVLHLDEASESAAAFAVLEAARSRVTPTFLVLDRQGRPTARFVGATSYLAISGALDDQP
ncbi:MAG: hypothetical protein VKO21_07040 [Candidatus Sericytochromatia bacterium]|nr:hypothetical protein [Candidatus Sericytochromatia bacterium]